MPDAKLNTTARGEEGAADAISQPVRGSRRRRRVSTSSASAGDHREPEQPAGLIAERGLEQAERAGRAAEQGSAEAAAPAAPRPGPARWPTVGRRPGPGRCSRRSATRCCCRRCRRSTAGRPPGSASRATARRRRRRPSPAPPASSWRNAVRRARQVSPQRLHIQASAIPGTISSATPIFVSNPSPTQTPHSTSHCVRPVSSARTRAPQRRHAAQDQQLVGVVVARDRDGDRGDRERRPATNPATRPNAPRQVVDQRDGGDAHQRLGHQDAQRMEAEHPDRQRLDPERERRLVDRHQPGLVERREQEVVPARAHRADGGACSTCWPSR